VSLAKHGRGQPNEPEDTPARAVEQSAKLLALYTERRHYAMGGSRPLCTHVTSPEAPTSITAGGKRPCKNQSDEFFISSARISSI
jgi:hypothetical protein